MIDPFELNKILRSEVAELRLRVLDLAQQQQQEVERLRVLRGTLDAEVARMRAIRRAARSNGTATAATST